MADPDSRVGWRSIVAAVVFSLVFSTVAILSVGPLTLLVNALMPNLVALLGWPVIAAILWSLLGLSLAATVWGLARRVWLSLAAAAILSLVFSTLAILSVGPFTLLLTSLQIAGTVALRVAASWPQRITVLFVGVVVWFALIGKVLIPFWFGYV